MKIVNYLSCTAVPFTVFLIVMYGIVERIKVFDVFLKGAKEGVEIIFKIFPTMIGLFIAIGMLRSSGILELIIKIISPCISSLGIPKEIMPLAILRPISRKCFYCSRKRYYERIWSR